MGSAQTKGDIITPSTPVRSELLENITPIQRTLSSTLEDPRSPGCERTPIHSPSFSRNAREKLLLRLGSASKLNYLDPRSPASRTPLHLSTADATPTSTPPLLSIADPRSPYTNRTPLALSQQEPAVPDGTELAVEDKLEEAEIADTTPVLFTLPDDSTTAVESTSNRVVVETFSSPEVSATIIALVMSPLNSPSLGGRKKRDLRMGHVLSPLKKSYSAPVDENCPPSSPSPLTKSISTTHHHHNNGVRAARTPLSPINNNRSNTRSCAGVQPIKFRMDPGILG